MSKRFYIGYTALFVCAVVAVYYRTGPDLAAAIEIPTLSFLGMLPLARWRRGSGVLPPM